MKTEHAIRRDVAECAQELAQRGWVANHDGNVSARLSDGRYVATPTGVAKRRIDRESLLVVDATGRVLRGRLRVFSEFGLHRTVFVGRADAGAVVHAHPPHATALAVREASLPCFMPEAVVSLGPAVPLVPFALPGADAERALAPFVADFDAVLLARHGVLTWGDDVEQAFLRMELVEHLARIALLASSVPHTPALPVGADSKLLEARTRAGLGPAGRASKR